MSSRDWVIKDANVWKGYDCEMGVYFTQPIQFDGDLQFDKYYEQLVVSDKDSMSCNLIWSIKKLIFRGGQCSLSTENWISLWLQFSKRYMTSAYSNLSRYSDDLETLFQEMVTNINVDEELSKIRGTMSKLHRRPAVTST